MNEPLKTGYPLTQEAVNELRDLDNGFEGDETLDPSLVGVEANRVKPSILMNIFEIVPIGVPFRSSKIQPFIQVITHLAPSTQYDYISCTLRCAVASGNPSIKKLDSGAYILTPGPVE